MCFAIGVAIVACVVFVRGANAEQRVRRFAYYGVAGGVAASVPFILAANSPSLSDSFAFVILAVLAALLALFGATMSIRTLMVRRREPGLGIGIPIVGLLFSVSGLIGAAGIYVIGGRILIPKEETTRNWHCDEHAFDVTIPSDRWVQRSNRNVLGEFRGTRPSIVALVAEARPGATKQEFDAALAFGLEMQTTTPTKNTFRANGKNAHGNDYTIYMGDAKSAKNEVYFFGFSITRVRDKSIIMLVEGPYNMSSQVVHAQEAEALRAQAKVFLSSAR